jgi:hypothetical protein
VTKNYFYFIYKKKSKKCPYIITKYSNYLSTIYLANSKLCEVYLAIKATTTILTITINE